jgi:hypothetical protein
VNLSLGFDRYTLFIFNYKIKVMLWAVKKIFDDGTVTDEIISSPEPYVINVKKDKVRTGAVSIHKYDYEHIYPPTLFVDSKGKKFILPLWIEVHPDTTVDDVNWTRPKLKKEIERVQGSMGVYKTTYDPNKKTYKCTCMGFWRSKGNCKHVKSLKEKNKNN